MLANLYTPHNQDNGTVTYSRDLQDRYAIDKIFRRKKNGYFLDIGASDGISENNTILMERYYDWYGICCECDPRDIMKLRSERTCDIIASPVFRTTGEIINFELHHANHLSSIEGYQIKQYRLNLCDMVSMTTISLMDCLRRYNSPTVIDYMSLDTEGTEYEILQTFDFNKYTINYIALEHNFQEPKRTQIRHLLESKGYAYHRSIVCDDDYILCDYAKKNNIPLQQIE